MKRILVPMGMMGILSAFFFLGCGKGKSVIPPEVAFLNISQAQWKVLGGTAVVHLQVSNPNPEPMRLEGMRVELLANGQTFARGMTPANMEIPAFGNTSLTVPVTLSNLDLLRSLLGIGKNKGIDYAMRSEVTFLDAKNERHTSSDKKTGSLGAHMFEGL